MHKLIPDLELTKVTLWDNTKLVIENYKKILDISDKLIKVDKYLIEGKNLKILELNQFMIKIYGEIKEVSTE